MDINKKIDVFFNKIDCPICKSQIQTHYKTHDIPYFGEIIFLTLICQNCGYKRNDLFSVYEKEPKRYIFKFTDDSDLTIKVVRSGSCTIKIPEFGTIIEPGVESEGYITNIEGVLVRVNDVLVTLEKDSHDEATLNRILELKNKLNEAKEGKLTFTLILEDPTGNSAILTEDNSKLKVEKL
ncbi:MAG: ZPR1 zinc finger domain-containing protein [Candidatus Helarchaeota archaeon]|nr:ZPR1 zinc finger domain-containing protein [Candidatus Helarchaeota archaeon]